MKKYLPSKTFLKFFGIIIGVAILIWIVSLVFFRKESYESKNKQTDLLSSEELGVYGMDSDSDGVYDWEEGLWGTDSKKADTNDDGISDFDEISAKRRQIQAESGNDGSADLENDEELSQTEIFARQFIATASLVDQAGGLTPEALSGFSSSLKQSIESSTIKDPFTLLDIKLGSVSDDEYKKSLETVFADYLKSGLMDLEVIYRFSQNVPGADAEISELVDVYSDLSSKILATTAPHNLAGAHLGMANNSSKIAIALLNISKLSSDPLMSMLGLKQYQEYSAGLEKNINSLARDLN